MIRIYLHMVHIYLFVETVVEMFSFENIVSDIFLITM